LYPLYSARTSKLTAANLRILSTVKDNLMKSGRYIDILFGRGCVYEQLDNIKEALPEAIHYSQNGHTKTTIPNRATW
jgi:hypothetical protein